MIPFWNDLWFPLLLAPTGGRQTLTLGVGPSGCGKSTLLRAIAGLETVNDLAPAKREIAMVFQSYALYPHMDVASNMAFGLKFAKTPKPEIAARVAEAARILQLEPLLKRRPRELSGGQRQRVAIGRPIVDVTHDQVEAMTLADKIVVMNKGRIEPTGKPLDPDYKPANLFVAGFIGSPAMNFLAATVVGPDSLELGSGQKLAVKLPPACKAGDTVTLGCRPEHMSLISAGGPRIAGTVDIIERLGESGFAHMRLALGQTVIVEVRGDPHLHNGDAATVSLDPEHLHVFDASGSALR